VSTEEVLAKMGITEGVKERPPIPLSERITGKTLSYDALVDIMLLSPPGETQTQIARRLGYSPSWLSRIIASDAFQAKMADRIEKDVEPERREMIRLRFASIEEEAKGLLQASLQKLSAKLEQPEVSEELLVKTATMTSKLLGYGARNDLPAPKVEMHVHLTQLADNVRKLSRAPINSEAIEVPPVLGRQPVPSSSGESK
jgi:hypothetical protein